MTDSDKLRANEARMDRELDDHLTELDREDKGLDCPFGLGENCRGCEHRIDCEE